MREFSKSIKIILLISGILLSACGDSDGLPTLSPEAIQTNAIATFSNSLTLTAIFIPTKTGTPTATATPAHALIS
ncbi:MAG: hypothetical protein HGA28_08390, partial [Anaerolineaceae bacterium]|nr:hypothetical protein [Anaerolineaceae bacterium]